MYALRFRLRLYARYTYFVPFGFACYTLYFIYTTTLVHELYVSFTTEYGVADKQYRTYDTDFITAHVSEVPQKRDTHGVR